MSDLNVNFSKVVAEFESVMKKQMLLKTVFYKRLFGGKGMEFGSFRDYSEEDDSSMIDWKATARAKRPLVRQYIEERDVKIFILIDSGDNMVFGSGNKLKLERAAEISACISHLILNSGDSVGYAMYSDKINFMKGIAGGKKHYHHLIYGLTNKENYGNPSYLKKTLDFVSPRLKGVNAVFIISDFMNLDNETIEEIKKFSRLHETVGIMVRDPVDENLPDIKNEVAIEDSRTGEQLVIKPDLVNNLYSQIASRDRKFISQSLEKIGVSVFQNFTHEDFILPFARFLKNRTKEGVKK